MATAQKKSDTTELAAPALVMQSDGGTVTIEPHVVAKIAGLAIREVAGVHALVPYGTTQALTNLAKSIAGDDFRDLGVRVEVGKVEAAIDTRIVTEYGVSIPGIGEAIRKNVADRIGAMTGLKVKELNIQVVDLYFEDKESAPAASPRVQ